MAEIDPGSNLTEKEKTIITEHLERYSQRKSPLDGSGPFKRALFTWMQPLLKVRNLSWE